VQGVSGQHGIDGRVRQRYRLSTTRQGTDSWQRAAQLDQHRRVGFDRNDVDAQRDQRAGQLAGSGAEVKHTPARRGFQRPAHRSQRVVRAMLGIFDRRYTKRRAEQYPRVLSHAVTLSAPRSSSS
jgi:hypothetical protein